MGTLDGRTALVTGGGRGIGAAIARGLAAEGADIAINYAKRSGHAEEVAESIRAGGRRAEIFQADVSDYAACEAMVEQVLDRLGPISILVNNAGIASRGNTVGEGEPAEMERVVRTHAFGSWYMAHLLIPQMREQERGDVVQITSAATSGLQANGSPYNMAKAAQEAKAPPKVAARNSRRLEDFVELMNGANINTRYLTAGCSLSLAEPAPWRSRL